MTISTILLVIAAIFSNVIASLLLKQYSISSDGISFALYAPKVYILAGSSLLFYAVAFVVYALVLRTLPVSKAYMLITFGSQIMLIISSAFFFGEQFNSLAWAGVILVFFGLTLVGISAV
jgi:multidrug transporter EmrE-like cation transporter